MSPHRIIWLEDRPDTITPLKIFCEREHFRVELVSTPPAFYDKLCDSAGGIALVVVDIMLYGVNDLSSIDMQDAYTDNGINAGWIILQRLLRAAETDEKIRKIPVLVLSTKPQYGKEKALLDGIQMARKEGDGYVRYLEKASGGWEDTFKELILGLKTSKNERG